MLRIIIMVDGQTPYEMPCVALSQHVFKTNYARQDILDWCQETGCGQYQELMDTLTFDCDAKYTMFLLMWPR